MKSIKYVESFLLYWQFFMCGFYELLGICVAYKKQPEVSNTTKKETKMGHGTNAVKIQNGQ